MKRITLALLLALTAVSCASLPASRSEPNEPYVEIFVRNSSGGPVALYLQGERRVATAEPGSRCIRITVPEGSHFIVGIKHLAERVVYSDFASNFAAYRFWEMDLRGPHMAVHDLNSLRPGPTCAERSGAVRDLRMGIMNVGR